MCSRSQCYQVLTSPSFLESSGKDFGDITRDVSWVILWVTARQPPFMRKNIVSEHKKEEPWGQTQREIWRVGPYPTESTGLTQAVFHGTDFVRELQPDCLSIQHTFLKSHSGILTVLLKVVFVETHRLRCLSTELAVGQKVVTRGPMDHLLAQGPRNLCFRKKPAKKTKSFTPLDVCMITCKVENHSSAGNKWSWTPSFVACG